MSKSSFLASSLEAEFKVLAPVNDAMIDLKLYNFGRASDLGIGMDNIRTSKKVLFNFLNEILNWLNKKKGNAVFYFVFRILLTSRRSPDEWKKTLLKLIETLQSDSEITVQDLESLEELLSQIDEQISSKVAQLNTM